MDQTGTPPGPGAGPTAPPPPPHRHALGGFFDSMRRSGLVRPDESTRSGPGVCTAIGNRLGIDATLVRVGVIVLTVFGGFGLLAYGVAWLLFPQADGHIHAEDMLAGRFTSGGAGSLFAIFFGFGGFGNWWWEAGGNWGAVIALASIAGVGALVYYGVQQSRQSGTAPGAVGDRSGQAPMGAPMGAAPTVALSKGERVELTKPDLSRPLAPPAPFQQRPVTPPPMRRRPAGPALTSLIAGFALVAAAAVLLIDRVSSLGGDSLLLATGAAVVVIGLAVLLAGLAGRRAGGLSGLAVVALMLLGVGWTDAHAGGVLSDWRSGERASSFGDRSWTPDTVRDGDSYSVEFGSGTLDLTSVRTTGGEPPTLMTDVRLGSMQVEVSDDQTIELDLQVTEGSIEVPGSSASGRNRDTTTTIGPAGPVDLRIEGTVRLGELVVQEENR